MSNNLLSIAAGSIVSLLAGVSLTLVFAAETLEAVPDNGSDAMFDVARGLQKTQLRLDRIERVLERELGATRRDMHLVLDGHTASSPASGPPESVGVEADDSETTESHVFRDDVDRLQPKNAAALGVLSEWKADEDVRARWLFASETASLESFGTPDEVSVRGTSEWWTYWNVKSGEIASEYRLQFNHGRLVAASLVTWKKPRAIPSAPR